MRTGILFVYFTLAAMLLTGCSGHPGAGKWTATKEDNTLFAHIKVDFDGKATISPKDSQAPTRNCYWQASSADSIAIQCGTSEQQEGTLFYILQVTEPTLAVLKKDEQVLGQFKREP